MKLLIAIPALNEENSIESIIERSLAARTYIAGHSPVSTVEITVVSDGSTDDTVPRACRYADRVNLIVFDKNRGYGAAIKEAWRRSDADLLGFLDADGTCDPRFFADLCRLIEDEEADIVLGCRLNAQSRMPLIRRVGNIVFAVLLRVFSSQQVRDTASGMRVVRRTCLDRLYPLPDGLHFTPAMSARALLSGDLRLAEKDMPYHEREGESKLRVGKDGLRFLNVILRAALLYRPSRPLNLLGLLALLAAVTLMVPPVIYYGQHHSVLEWMIYRFVVAQLAGISGLMLFGASYLTARMVNLTISRQSGVSEPLSTGVIRYFLHRRVPYAAAGLLIATGTALVVPSFLELVRTGATYEHWSRFIVMSSLDLTGILLLILKGVDAVLDLLAERLAYFDQRAVQQTRAVAAGR